MLPPQPRTRSRRLWLAHRAAAWIACILALGCVTTVALRTVEAAANRALADWRGRRQAAAGRIDSVIPLTDGVVVKQLLPSGNHRLRGISLATTAAGDPAQPAEEKTAKPAAKKTAQPAAKKTAQPVVWKLVRVDAAGGTNTLVRSGSVAPADIDTAGWLHIDFEPLAIAGARRHLLKLLAPAGSAGQPIGLTVEHARLPAAPPTVNAGPASTRAPAQPRPGTCLRMRLTVDATTADGGLP